VLNPPEATLQAQTEEVQATCPGYCCNSNRIFYCTTGICGQRTCTISLLLTMVKLTVSLSGSKNQLPFHCWRH